MIYLDNAATTFLKPPEVEQAVQEAFHTLGNAGRGAHCYTLRASRLVYDTREKLAQLFHASSPETIAFTSNATEALNTAILGLFQPKDHIITTVCEHNSVLRPLYLLEKNGVEVSFISTDAQGRILYDEMERACKDNTKAIVVTHASNLTGNVTDLQKVSTIAKKHGLLLMLDASQTAGVLPIDVEQMGIDILCFTGHKGLMGPQGTGGLYVRPGIVVRSLKTGGSGIHSFDHSHPNRMPEALEAGTLNGHGIAGLNAAITYILDLGAEQIGNEEIKLAERFRQGILSAKNIKIYGTAVASQRVGIVSVNIGDMDSGVVSEILWEDYAIAVRAGAHCAPLMHKALGTQDQGAVRFSFSYYNTLEEVDTAIRAVRQIAEQE
jgi:cysteine desulfurase family protein